MLRGPIKTRFFRIQARFGVDFGGLGVLQGVPNCTTGRQKERPGTLREFKKCLRGPPRSVQDLKKSSERGAPSFARVHCHCCNLEPSAMAREEDFMMLSHISDVDVLTAGGRTLLRSSSLGTAGYSVV